MSFIFNSWIAIVTSCSGCQIIIITSNEVASSWLVWNLYGRKSKASLWILSSLPLTTQLTYSGTVFSFRQNQQAVFTQAMEDTPTVEQPFNIHLSCPSLTLVLRWAMKCSIDTLTRLIIRTVWYTLKTVFSPYTDGKSNIIKGTWIFWLVTWARARNCSFTCR